MRDMIQLGIDCGGTHTDAALVRADAAGKAFLLASAKTVTDHDNLPGTIARVIALLGDGPGAFPAMPDNITLATTLEINAIVQKLTPPVGLALSAGPGLDPVHFALGDDVCIVPGGLDHRGTEVTSLYLDELATRCKNWKDSGITVAACVSKFSPRNPAHELAMARTIKEASGLDVVQGHNVSGSLNFPRRIATAYYSASVSHLHSSFLASVEKAIQGTGLNADLRLLKADGGAIPFSLSRKEPVQSILSGPAASVMGCMALWKDAANECGLLIDIGGTTTDLAILVNGSPVIDRNGMKIEGRRTLVRSLASLSIPIGGDSEISADLNDGILSVRTGPLRIGPALAFGGERPALLDALNYLDSGEDNLDRGNVAQSLDGIEKFARDKGVKPRYMAEKAINYALNKIIRACYKLIEDVNSRPIYTLAALRAVKEARPSVIYLIGGPAEAIARRLESAAGLRTTILPYAHFANAIGAALAIPTAEMEIYADTGKRELFAPSVNYTESIQSSYTLEDAEERCLNLLRQKLLQENIKDVPLEITESDLFATLDDRGRSARDIRVVCQVKPGIYARMEP